MTHTSIERYQTAIDALFAAHANGTIYNVDFKDWKDSANRAYERAHGELVREPFFNGGKYEQRTERERDIEDAISYGLHQFPSKKLMKLIEGRLSETPMISAVIELITIWKPVSDTAKALKPMVVMGRKPSTDPRKTPERTLDNTGTCSDPMCSRNVKLRKDSKITDHGYTIRWGFQSGNCFGVDYDPIEVSTEGLVAVKESCERGRDNLLKNIATLEAGPETLTENKKVSFAYNAPRKDFTYEEGTPEYKTLLTNRLYETKRNLKHCESHIKMCQERIDTWEPTTLPGAKA